MRIFVRGQKIEITEQTIRQTREWFAEKARECARQAAEGDFHVNDLQRYLDQQIEKERAALAGEFDKSVTFAQMAFFIQTGESVPLIDS